MPVTRSRQLEGSGTTTFMRLGLGSPPKKTAAKLLLTKKRSVF
jgi:hypothetical protein